MIVKCLVRTDKNVMFCVIAPGLSKRKRIDDKKRKHHPEPIAVDKKKRVKVEAFLNPDESEISLSDQDKSVLDRWKRIQQTTRPFIHPIRKMVKSQGNGAEGVSLAYFQQQVEQIEQQQKQIDEQKKVIQEQQEQIRVLQEQNKVLICECQAAGIKIPQFGSQEIIPNVNHPPQPTVPPQPSQQTSRTYSGVQPPLLHTQPPPLQPPVSPSSVVSVTVNPPPFTSVSPPNPHHPPPQPMHPTPSKSTVSHLQNPHLTTQFPLPPSQQASHALASYPSTGASTSPMMTNLAFSPLPPAEFVANDRQSLSSYSPNPYDPDELENILNIAGLPTGSGAGYGVGVMEEEMVTPQLDLR